MSQLTESQLQEIRRSRRHPRRTAPDYLHLQYLVADLAAALSTLPHEVRDVLDVFCGTRPYDDLLPTGARSTGLDIDDRYGAADVVSTEFLPFESDSFDLVMCIEAFYYVADPATGVAEIARVLRPGGTAVITVPFVWEYDPTILEHRYTGPELEHMFRGWDDVKVVENGGRGVSWATMTGRILQLRERSLAGPLRRLGRPIFAALYAAVNGAGAMIERGERKRGEPQHSLPMNLMLTARRPAEG
jgi:SAM-dependent methyltransferase